MKRLATLLAATALALPACATDDDLYDGEEVKSEDGKADASALAVFVDFTFEGTLLTDSSWNDKSTIQDQLLYTVGMLNEFNSVGRVDKAVITDIVKTTVNGKTQIKYKAVLPVAWGKRNAIPDKQELQLPLDISYAVFCLKKKRGVRSEEHTSELQSQSNLVCRLLLEIKKDSAKPTL